MKMNKPKQVFEHQLLPIDGKIFKKEHWEALDRYNEANGSRFFSLTSRGVKFKQYVGVIQVGNLTIEVLPKVSQTVEKGDEGKWQGVLIDMLRECRWMQVHAQEKAPLRFKPNSILEAYLAIFIQECQNIVRLGLVKKYRAVERNCTALKGKLLFGEQIQKNTIHKERFYTRHQVYDWENIFNQILFKALKLIPSISQSPYLKDRVYSLFLAFPELADIEVQPATFEKLVFNRKTAHYKEAIDIAAMLLLNYRPDISTGRNHILAILFDMNDLWEEYIFRQLYRHKPEGWLVKPQAVKTFWQLTKDTGTKTIKPDIVVQHTERDTSFILDTKWKLPDGNIPADADLKQMYVYNEYWHGLNAVLVYPAALYAKVPEYHEGEFAKKRKGLPAHKCGLVKIAVLDEHNTCLDKTIGKRLFAFLEKEFENNEEQ